MAIVLDSGFDERDLPKNELQTAGYENCECCARRLLIKKKKKKYINKRIQINK